MVRRLAALAGLLAGLGCGSWEPPSTGAPWSDAWGYPERQFVIDRLILPTTNEEARALAFDLDGDGNTDNQLGSIAAAIGRFNDWTLQGEVDQPIAQGDDITLLSLYARDLQTSDHANLWTFIGQPQVLTDGPQPGGTFAVDTTNGPTDAWLGGALRGGTGTFGGDDGVVWLKIGVFGDEPLELRAARVELAVSADGLVNGRVGGALLESEVTGKVIPGLAARLDAEIQASCSGSPCTCPQGSGAALIEEYFDPDHDCRVTADELGQNSIIQVFAPGDVTLASGEHALSLALGFTAVAAHFDHPAPPP